MTEKKQSKGHRNIKHFRPILPKWPLPKKVWGAEAMRSASPTFMRGSVTCRHCEKVWVGPDILHSQRASGWCQWRWLAGPKWVARAAESTGYNIHWTPRFHFQPMWTWTSSLISYSLFPGLLSMTKKGVGYFTGLLWRTNELEHVKSHRSIPDTY